MHFLVRSESLCTFLQLLVRACQYLLSNNKECR